MELLYLLIFDTRAAADALAARNTGLSGMLLLAGEVLSVLTGLYLLFSFGGLRGLTSLGVMAVILFLFCTLLTLFVSALYNYFAEAFGGGGRGAVLFRVLPFAGIPFLFLTPGIIIVTAMFPVSGWFLLFLFALFLSGWSFYLQASLIGGVYGLKQTEAAAVCALPWAVIAVTGILFPLITTAGIVAMAVL